MLELELVSDPWFYVLAIPAVLSIGIAKGGIGGTGGVAVPLMSLAISVPQAAAILLPIICIGDIFAVWTYWGTWDARNLKIIVPGALVGIVVGTLCFSLLDPLGMKVIIGVIALWFSSDSLFGRRRHKKPTEPNVVKGGFWSALSGFTSFIAHSGSPPLSVYMIPQRMDKTLYVGTLTVYFTVVNYAKIGPYAWLGQINVENMSTAVVLLPLIPLGVWIGRWMHRSFDDRIFYRIILIILFISGIKLTYDGMIGLFFG